MSPTSCSPRKRRTATRQGQRTKKRGGTPYDSQGKGHSPRHPGDAVRVGRIEEQETPRKDNARMRQLHAAGHGRDGHLDGNEVRHDEPSGHQEQCHPHGDKPGNGAHRKLHFGRLAATVE